MTIPAGSVSVDVVPNAEQFWSEFVQRTRGGAGTAGAQIGRELGDPIGDAAGTRARDLIEAHLQRLSADVNVNVDRSGLNQLDTDLGNLRSRLDQVRGDSSGGAQGAGSEVNKLVAALVTLGPAVVPVASVAGGALAGLIPTIATVALGIKGITTEYQNGSLAGTKYGDDINSLKSEYSQLQKIAAAGLLPGIDSALQNAQSLFPTVNADVKQMSTEIGNIVAGAAPALVKILTDLNPLFATFGTVLTQGATQLDHWAENSTGVTSFVHYVQAELPEVLTLTGDLATLLGHVVQAVAPFGGVVLSDLTAFVRVLDDIPVGVLETAIPLAISLYTAFLAYRGVNTIVNGVSRAVTSLTNTLGLTGPKAAASALQQNAAALSVQAEAAAAAASVAASEAAKATATADAATDIAATLEGTDSALAATATAAADAAIEFAAAMRAEAEAAAATAVSIGESAQAAATESRAAGAEASVGWASMLGPAAGLVVGVSLLSTLFHNNGNAARQNAADVDALSDAIKADSGVVGENTQQWVANALQKSGALEAARNLGVSLSDATQAALGNAPAQAKVNAEISKYLGVSTDLQKLANAPTTGEGALKGQTGEEIKLAQAIYGTNSKVKEAVQGAKDQTAATNTNTTSIQTNAQALKTWLTAIDKVITASLSNAQTQDQFMEAVNNVTTSVKTNGTSLSQNTAKGLNNRDAFLSAVQAALSYRDSQEKAGTSAASATKNLAKNISSLEKQAEKAGLSKTQVEALIKQLHLVPGSITAKIKADTSPAAKSLQKFINTKSVKYVQVVTTGAGAPSGGHTDPEVGHAAGGPINGRGPKGVDSVQFVGAPGEWVINDKAVDKLKAAYGPGVMSMINQGQAPTASGGQTAGSGSSGRDVTLNVYPSAQLSETAIGTAAARRLSMLGAV